MSLVRGCTVVVSAVGLLALCHVQSAVGASPKDCNGRDLLAELLKKSPQRYDQAVERSRSQINSWHMLWRVAGEAGGATSYLLGTVHVSSERLQVLTQATREAILASRVVVLEGRPPSRAGLAPELVHVLKPWAASMFQARSSCEEMRQSDGLKPMDVVVAEFGASNGRAIRGLETALEQYQALAEVPEDAQVAWLKASIRLSARLEDMTETTARLYEKRLMPVVWDLTMEYSGEALTLPTLDIIRSALVDRRNLLMRDRATPMLRLGAFIAVGALHLPGPGGRA